MSAQTTLVRMAEHAPLLASLTHACVNRAGQATVARTTVRKEADILDLKYKMFNY